MRKPRALINLHLLLMLGIAGYSIFSYISLPDRYAAHINFAGEVDRWADKGGVEYWIVPAVAIIIGSLLLLLLRFPRFFDYPQKKQVNRWPEWRRMPVYEKLMEMMMVVAVLVDILLLSIQMTVVNSASGEMGFFAIGVLGPTALMPVVLIIYLVKISRVVETVEHQLKLTGALSESGNA